MGRLRSQDAAECGATLAALENARGVSPNYHSSRRGKYGMTTLSRTVRSEAYAPQAIFVSAASL